MPIYHTLLWPTLEAVSHAGGSATVQEINDGVITSMGFTDEQQEVLHGQGPQTEIEYRLAWARTNLKWIGLLDNSARGVWSLTEKGRSTTAEEVIALDRARRQEANRERQERLRQEAEQAVGIDEDEAEEQVEELTWKQRLLLRLLDLDPAAFERLAQRLLREAGFVNVTVTGRSGDGGIDGVGVYRLSLVSFPVYVQCKRYSGSVGPGAVRDFRGAMEGRGEKGLLITTASFSRDAQSEATRDGARPIELIDGDRLCDLLREYGLGVEVRQRLEYDVEVIDSFFAEV
jgi:restriction system protein